MFYFFIKSVLMGEYWQQPQFTLVRWAKLHILKYDGWSLCLYCALAIMPALRPLFGPHMRSTVSIGLVYSEVGIC